MENTSQIRTGWPARTESRPAGVVVVTWSSRVVGAIWPPVMPYTPLLTKITVMFSPRLAAWKPSAVPMAARSPSPWYEKTRLSGSTRLMPVATAAPRPWADSSTSISK